MSLAGMGLPGGGPSACIRGLASLLKEQIANTTGITSCGGLGHSDSAGQSTGAGYVPRVVGLRPDKTLLTKLLAGCVGSAAVPVVWMEACGF